MTDVRFLKDANGNDYYPVAHADYIEGLSLPDNLEKLDTIESDVGTAKLDITNLRSIVNDLVRDTGWLNIALETGIEIYSSGNVPQARLVTVNGVSFLSLRGSIKGVTTNVDVKVGTIPATIANSISSTLYYVQNTSVVSGKPNYTRMYVSTSGVLTIERSSIESPTSTQWYPIHQTFML